MTGTFTSIGELLRSSKKTILAIVVTGVIAFAIGATISLYSPGTSDLHIPSFADVRTLGVLAYWDHDCTDRVESVDWGTIVVGSSSSTPPIYLKSMTPQETFLYLNTTEWVPAGISDYMTLSWNYTEAPVQPDEVIRVTLTLSASSSSSFVRFAVDNEVDEFSFDIVIYTSEQGI